MDWTRFDAVIFDLDGTLVNSMGMWHRIDIVYLGAYGIPVPEDLHRELEHLSFKQTAIYFKKRFDIPESTDEIENTWLRMARKEYREVVTLKEGAAEFLRFLKKKGIRTAIASSNSRDLIYDAVDAHGITDLFDEVTACDEVKANKPDPAVYLYTAQKLGITPERCLVFEDILPGIRAGLAAGMTVYAVDDEYSAPIEEMKRKEAHGYIKDFRASELYEKDDKSI